MKQQSLKSMAEGKVEGIQKITQFKVHPKFVEFEEGFNLRQDTPELREHIQRLKAAMKAGAYIPPIDVQVIGDRTLLRDGHCRTTAALELNDEGFEYLLECRQIRGNDADAVFHMIGANGGMGFTPLELGIGFLRLIHMGKTVAEISARTGLHRSTVENGLALAETPAAVQAMIASGEVASHTALKVVRKEGGEAATEILTKAVKTAKTSGKKKATGKHIAPKKPAAKPAKTPTKGRRESDPTLTADEAQKLVALAHKVAALNQKTATPVELGILVREARAIVGSPVKVGKVAP